MVCLYELNWANHDLLMHTYLYARNLQSVISAKAEIHLSQVLSFQTPLWGENPQTPFKLCSWSVAMTVSAMCSPGSSPAGEEPGEHKLHLYRPLYLTMNKLLHHRMIALFNLIRGITLYYFTFIQYGDPVGNIIGAVHIMGNNH